MYKRRGKYRNSFTIGTALLLILALLITGTFALLINSLTAGTSNVVPAGGRLHNDFEVMGTNFGESKWQQGVSANKNVYLENFEDTTGQNRDIFVRLRLYEYLEVGPGARLQPGDRGYDERNAKSVIPGAKREDVRTWSPRLPGTGDASDLFRMYWTWEMGGEKIYMPTFNRDPMSKEVDTKGDAISLQRLQNGEVRNTTLPDQLHAYPEEAGLLDYFEINNRHTAQLKYWDGSGHRISPGPVTFAARKTHNAKIIPMTAWDKQIDNVWVMDDDGWFYWAAPLAPQTATGLLLRSITLNSRINGEWYYAVHVEAQVATGDDWQTVFYTDPAHKPSARAEELMKIITFVPDPNPVLSLFALSRSEAKRYRSARGVLPV